MLSKLYKKDSKNKIREWSILTNKDTRGFYYEISHGEKDGKLQSSRTYIEVGKNVGRSNETTPENQCKAEAKSQWQKQISRKGYSEDIPTEAPLKPMLAKKLVDEERKVKYPCAMQAKIDGGRCLAKITKDGVELISRTMNLYEGLSHIEKELAPLWKKCGDLILDGELYNHYEDFEEIMSLVRKTKNHTQESEKIQYWVYDMISDKTFHERYIDWSNIISGLTNVCPTPTYIVKTREEIDIKHIRFIENGYEGSMIRNLDSLYKINARSSDLLKYKNFDDNEFEIIGYKRGTGKFENIPTFELKTKEGNTFEGVPKGSEKLRNEYLAKANDYIGKFVTVRYFGYTKTDKPVPRFPVISDMHRENYE